MAAIELSRMAVMAWAVLCGLGLGLPGCGETAVPPGHERVRIEGRAFDLEIAADDAKRTQGLSGRESVPENGGMLFIFPRSDRRYFVMRDCLVPIDILFLDGSGRVVASHAMEVEEPQGPEESDMAYELRLKRYGSRYGAQFAIELRGGMIAELGVEEGDQIALDLERLKAMAR